MRLTVLCSRFPYPLEKGDKLRMYHQLRLLHERHEVSLICLSDGPVSTRDVGKIEDVTTECHVIYIPQWRRKLSLMTALLSGRSLQSAYYHSTATAKEIKEKIASFGPDHIYCQLTRMSPYVESLDITKTIDYMDAFGVGMERRAMVTSGLERWLYKIEAKRCKKYEEQVYHKFDNHTIISEQDRQQIAGGTAEITVNPNGIDTAYFTPIEAVKDHHIGFVGNMGYPPNIDAAEYLVKTLQFDDQYRVLIAGARPDRRVKLLANDSVTITGWVDDVRHEYARCKIFVAPLWSGTGQQNKILEAMAMGIPCVTTEAVNNAIHATHGEEIMIAQSPTEFKSAVKRLSEDQDLYQSMREKGLRLVKNNFSWQHNVDILEEIFNK